MSMQSLTDDLVHRLAGIVSPADLATLVHGGTRAAVTACRVELINRIHHEDPTLSRTEVGVFFSIDRTTVTYWLHADRCLVGGAAERIKQARREKDRLRTRLNRRRHEAILERRLTERHERYERMRLAIDAIPGDTRTLTGRLLGDPLPGRSALEARQRQVAA